MEDINKLFGRMIDQYFCDFFILNFLNAARAFSEMVSLLGLTTFIHPVFSVYEIYYIPVSTSNFQMAAI